MLALVHFDRQAEDLPAEALGNFKITADYSDVVEASEEEHRRHEWKEPADKFAAF